MVRTPGGEVVVDLTGRAPGRGAYVCADPACREAALAKGALRRVLSVSIPVELFTAGQSTDAASTHMLNDDDREGGA